VKALTEQQLRDYRHDGFLFPLPGLAPEELAKSLDDLGRLEARLGSPLPQAEMKWARAPYIYLPWADALVRHPRILDAVEDVIGPDILVYWCTFFIKEQGSPAFVAWHQDATYFGLRPHEQVQAWLALNEASIAAGCMEVLSSHGAPRQLHHEAAMLKHSLNGGGQHIVEPLDESEAVAMELRAGEFSLHHTLCTHRSAPNRAPHRRVGLGISYIPAHVRPVGSRRLSALLVRGTDRWGNFDLLPSPTGEFTPEAIDVHERTYKRYREHYSAMQVAHKAEFAARAT
jgi:hypothetical protein